MTNIRDIVQASSFVPTARQIRARNKWAEVNPDMECATAEAAMALGAPQAIIRWWSTPGFSEWWNASSWAREEAEAALLQGMARISDILRDQESPPQLLIAAAKEAREVWTKLNSGVEQKFADEAIGQMDRKELEEFIRKKTSVISGT